MYLLRSPDLRLAQTVYGVPIYVDANTHLGRLCIGSGVWETGTTRLLLDKLKEGDLFVDVGANVGYYTVLAASRVGDQGKVISFEPDPGNFRILSRNAVAFGSGNVTCEQLGVGSEDSRARLWLDPFDNATHSIVQRSGMHHYIDFRMTSLDNYFESRNLRCPDVIKIDTEGCEPLVLNGMSKLIGRTEALKLVVEFNPFLLMKNNANPQAFLSKLTQVGFTLNTISKDGKPKPVSLARVLQVKREQNLYCEK